MKSPTFALLQVRGFVALSHYEKYGRAYYTKNKQKEKQRNKDYYLKIGHVKKQESYLEKRTRILKNRYGITEAEYLNLLSIQGNVCAICKEPPKENRNLDIDHCHRTNKVRGLLCNNCNRGLGHMKDSIERLETAIKYLKGDITGHGGTCGA